MNKTYASYEELISAAEKYLRDIGRAENSIKIYLWAWDRLKRYMIEKQINEYSEEVALEYIMALFGDKPICKLTHYQKDHLRHVTSLAFFIKTGEIPNYIYRKPRYKLHPDFEKPIQEYLEYKKTMRVSEITLKAYRWHLYLFSEFLSSNGVQSVQHISPLALMRYATDSFPNEAAAKNQSLIVIKRFLKYLYENEHIKRDISSIVPKDYYRQQAKLPSTFTKEEITTILNSIDQSNSIGKRNYAIVLLAVRLGMRASDISTLDFSHLQWATNQICFTQMKTGRPIVLPLPSDVGESIINYIKNSRPKSDNTSVFLSPRYPHNAIDSDGISHLVRVLILKSGVKIGDRKYGPHALRHTMASFMVNEGTTLPVIAEVLGHSSVQTSMNYLRISIETMRQCAMEVPIIPESYYEQKGGMFYV